MANAFNSIARAFRGGLVPKAARAYIIPLNIHQGDRPIRGDVRTFQYFPSTIHDTRGTNYQTKVIPGLSHPLYQWTSTGERIVTFQAVFSRDRSLSNQELTQSRTPRDVASVSNSFGVISQSFGALQIASSTDPRNVDIPSAVAWLRSFLDPEYSEDGEGTRSEVPSRPYPPRKMILGLPGLRMNWGVRSLPPSEMYCLMKQCDVTYDGFFNDGTPRLARVDLAFAEIIQVEGDIRVQDAADRRSVAYAGYTLTDKSIKDSLPEG